MPNDDLKGGGVGLYYEQFAGLPISEHATSCSDKMPHIGTGGNRELSQFVHDAARLSPLGAAGLLLPEKASAG